MPISPEEPQEQLTLSALLAHIGSRSLRPLVLAPGSDPVVSGTELIDASEQLPELPGTLLFVISGAELSSDYLRTVAEQAANYGYAAIVMKPSSARREEIRTIADNAGIALLEVAEHVTWRYLEAAVDSLLGERNVVASSSRHPSFEPLFSLVNSVAEAFGGSVAIEDLSRHILAYSSVPDQLIDTLRTDGILSRVAPYSPYNDEQYREVLRSLTPITFPKRDEEEARIGVAIRAGNIPLGTMWPIDGREDPSKPLNASEISLLTHAAETAASHMLDNLRIQEANLKPRQDVLRRLLIGTDVAGTELAELGLSEDRGVRLTGFWNPRCERSPIALAQVRSTVAKHYSAYRDDVTVVSLRGYVYVLIGAADDGESSTLAERALPLIDRVVGEGSRAAVTDAVTHAGEVVGSRQDLDAILRCAPEIPEPQLLTRDDVQSQLLLNRIRDLLDENPLLRNPSIEALREHRTQQSTDMLHTLEVWCAEHGNVARTAQALGVHENTVRYRLQRAVDQHDISLNSADDMLTLWLQLRLGVSEADSTS